VVAQGTGASAPPLIHPYWHQARAASDRLSPADLTLLGPVPLTAGQGLSLGVRVRPYTAVYCHSGPS